MMGVIGGTGLNRMMGLTDIEEVAVQTPYDSKPVSISCGHFAGNRLAFLPRHGKGHVVPPHRINYRANMQALHQLGCQAVIAVNAVGGIDPVLVPGAIAIPEQIIDYTWGREHTFFDGQNGQVEHIDFTAPYDASLRQLLIASAQREARLQLLARGVYACTQGPRLESMAEVQRLQRDGCDMVGMTGMPEAALARELGLPYACIALSVNLAAGLGEEVITMAAITAVLNSGMQRVLHILARVIIEWGQQREQNQAVEAGTAQ
ncbi:MAG: S-methyl-5'-thioinosine phosphorylase [Pseudomonadales bacterium]|nr:S-methyl-5'-thioinosine phosphorylase [Pseudomonadales bacterium]